MLCRAPVRRAGMAGAVAGIDLPAALRLAELAGYDVTALALLLPCAETGILKAASKEEG